MTKSFLAAFLMAAVILVCACSGNLFTTFSNEVSDASLLVAAQQFINEKDYTDALLQFPQMSTAYQKAPTVISLWAAAFAGQAGLDFLTLVNNFSNIGATPFLLFLMKNFDAGTAAEITSLQSAQTLMMSIDGSFTAYTNDQLLELVVIAMANIGTIISNQADPTGTGSVSGAFSACNLNASAPALLQQYGTSLNIVINGLTQLAANGVNFGPSIATFTGGCTTLNAIAPSFDFCTVPFGTAFAGNAITALEAILGDQTIIGINACPAGGGGTISGASCCGI